MNNSVVPDAVGRRRKVAIEGVNAGHFATHERATKNVHVRMFASLAPRCERRAAHFACMRKYGHAGIDSIGVADVFARAFALVSDESDARFAARAISSDMQTNRQSHDADAAIGDARFRDQRIARCAAPARSPQRKNRDRASHSGSG